MERLTLSQARTPDGVLQWATTLRALTVVREAAAGLAEGSLDAARPRVG